MIDHSEKPESREEHGGPSESAENEVVNDQQMIPDPSETMSGSADSSDAPDVSAELDEGAATQRDQPEGVTEDSAGEAEEFEGEIPSEFDSSSVATPIEEDLEPESESQIDAQKDWYILKVSSNREKSVCDGLKRRVSIAGLDRYFGEILVPTEDVAEFKNGRRRVVKRKLYPGYIVVHMAINDETWFLVRETPGIGDFTGAAGKPTPMMTHEVDRIVKATKTEEDGGEPIKTVIPFKPGDRVRIKEGTFENFEGDVEGIDEANGRVTVMINIFGRSTPVELEHWQIDAV